MLRIHKLVRLVLISAVLAGCAVRPPVEEPAEPMTASQELEGSPALGLLSRAEQARQDGRTAAAERYLERALGIAPDSSWLYKELAGLRLSEGDPRGAEGFALKALRLAPDHDAYRAGLWELVATARDRQGDKSGARQARDNARELRNPKARPV
ncbi:MAG: tetratricopeptide repeat protein [Pseudomonadota bacterium]|nr:tetratricopeptide repeat protein [Pseudomonadota bacterium]